MAQSEIAKQSDYDIGLQILLLGQFDKQDH